MAEKASDQNDQEAFFQELDSFQLHMPGGKTVDFCETAVLLNMVHKQYPRWKETGSVTSIPTARVPKLFLHNQQMTKEVEKKLKSLQKGDGAEKNLFRLFVEGSFQEQPGVLIFPNLDGSHVFQTQIAKVEIDMVLIHQSKGIFLFNVKNEGGKGTTERKIKEDREKHNRFIHMLMTYKNGTGTQNLPIHTVVCNFADTSRKFFNLEQDSQNEANKTLVFGKNSLKPEVFSKAWIKKIQFGGIEDVVWDSRLETLIARLVALNSVEGALSLIHNQMTGNLLQSVGKQEHLEAQMSTSDQKNEQFKRLVVEHSETTAGRKGRKRFILWTKDQMSTISRVYEHLTDPSSKKGLRLLVTGCKGSGKTMLLTFIANLSQSLLELQCEENLKGKILVCEGSFNSPLLMTLLRSALTSTDITLYSPPMTGAHFFILKAFHKDSLAHFRQEFSNQLQNAKILLCDEFMQENHDYLFRDLRKDQHCVLFASGKNYRIGSEYDVIHLGASLRSTCRIAKFADSWIKATRGSLLEFECKPAHNFEGENIDFTFVKDISSDSIENRNNFVAQCVNVICEHAEKSTGLEVIPVVALVDLEIKKMILEILKKHYTCYVPSYEINNDDSEGYIPIKDADKNTSADSPSIYFFSRIDIEGSEFGTVLVLLRLKDCSEMFSSLTQYFFTSITRATIKLAIVIDDVASVKELSHYDSHGIVTGHLQFSLTMAFKKRHSKPTVIIVGTKPNISGFRRQDSGSGEQVPAIDGISVYVGEQGCFLHIDDVYKKSDLQKLLNYGIQLVILFTESRSPWPHVFYYSSSICLYHFIERNGDCFYVCNCFWLDDEYGALTRIVSFCAEQSGIPGVVKPDINQLKEDLYDEPSPEGAIFSWDKWKAKGTEHYKLGQNNYAADRYRDSIVLLERQYNELISQSAINLSAAIQDRIELAKLCTNVALMYIKSSENSSNGQMDIYERFRCEEYLGSSFEMCMIPSFEYAMRAIGWHASWERGFQRAKTVMSKLKKHYSEKESSFGQTKDATLEETITEEESNNVDPCFAKFRKAYALPLPVFFQVKLEELDHMIADYEMKIQSLTFKQLIPLRKQISAFGKSLAQESLGLVPKHLAGTEVNFVDILKFRREATQVFNYPILLVMEALYWNPLEKDCYEILYQALDRLEKVVEYLERNAKCLGQQTYLEQATQYETEKYIAKQL